MRYANRDKPGARRNPGSPTSERRLVRRSSKSGAGLVLRSPRGGAGFTLLEVLVAMTILAILGAALFTMFNQTTGTWLRADAHVQQFIAAREALGLIALEMRHAVVAPEAAGGDKGAHFYGIDGGTDSDQVYFVAPAETRDDRADQDLCVIGYWVNNDRELMRYCLTDRNEADWRNLHPVNHLTHSERLGVNVAKLDFEYLDQTTTDWSDADKDWNSSATGPQHGTVPRAVRITLAVWDPTLEPDADPNKPEVKKRFKTFTTVVYMNNWRHPTR